MVRSAWSGWVGAGSAARRDRDESRSEYDPDGSPGWIDAIRFRCSGIGPRSLLRCGSP